MWGWSQCNGGGLNQPLFQSGMRITSFGQDEAGEVYLISDGGMVYQLVQK
jgi:hypothetical protein